MSTPAPNPPFAARFLSGGFRPFFLFGAVQAALMILFWVPWFLGFLHVPTALSPLAWHQHELLFGYIPAIIAGFLLTAVPSWTGRLPLTGPKLLGLFLLWLAGRAAIAGSESIGLPLAMALAVSFLPVLGVHVLRELLKARNTRNYKIVGVLTLFFAGQCLFYWEFLRFGRIEIADRVAIGAAILLIAIVGGRIVPVFTGNWLRKNNPGREPPAFGKLDIAVMALSGCALVLWPVAARLDGVAPLCGTLMLLAGVAQLARQSRWCPERTLAEPLVTVLHLAYAFIPLGFLLTGAALLTDDIGLRSAGVHAWTSGAIGAMTLAVMTRATRGHTGQALHAPASNVAFIYAPIFIAAIARIAAAIMPDQTMVLLPLAGLAWVIAFLGYATLYGGLLIKG